MRVLLAALMVLSALVTEGDCLKCIQCRLSGTVSCDGPSVPCRKGTTDCIVGLENNTDGAVTNLFAYKGCVDPAKQKTCDRNIVHRNSHISVRIKRECCRGDNCNNYVLQVPEIKGVPNGHKCPDCWHLKSRNDCIATQEVVCEDDQFKCATYNGLYYIAVDKPPFKYSHTGCNNYDACHAGVGAIETTHAQDIKYKCFDVTDV